MAEVEATRVIRQLLSVLREAFEGPMQRWS